MNVTTQARTVTRTVFAEANLATGRIRTWVDGEPRFLEFDPKHYSFREAAMTAAEEHSDLLALDVRRAPVAGALAYVVELRA